MTKKRLLRFYLEVRNEYRQAKSLLGELKDKIWDELPEFEHSIDGKELKWVKGENTSFDYGAAVKGMTKKQYEKYVEPYIVKTEYHKLTVRDGK